MDSKAEACAREFAEKFGRELDEARLAHQCSEGVIAMAVARLGGMVEGRPTERVNFLQRIDELRRIEAERDALAARVRELEATPGDAEDVISFPTKIVRTVPVTVAAGAEQDAELARYKALAGSQLRTIAEAGVILEALYAGTTWELAPEVRATIHNALDRYLRPAIEDPDGQRAAKEWAGLQAKAEELKRAGVPAPYWLIASLADYASIGNCRRGADRCSQSSDCITEWCAPCLGDYWLEANAKGWKDAPDDRPALGASAPEPEEGR